MQPLQCPHCGEAIPTHTHVGVIMVPHVGPLENGAALVTPQWYHSECIARLAVGSLAHVQGRCSCFVEGGPRGDPLGMTKREAARAALAAYRARAAWDDLENTPRN